LLACGGFGTGCAPKGWWLFSAAVGERDVRGARAVAVDDRRQPLHVGAKDLGAAIFQLLFQLRISS
jgi:hypothetical protein